MTASQDNVENMASYIGEKEKEDAGEESNHGDVEGDNKEKHMVGGEIAGEIGEKEVGGDSEEFKEEDCSDEDEEEAKQPKVDTEIKPDQVQVKKQPQVLNLNNEVVNMRKEVKRVRALLSRKLIRQIAGLKNKKGTEAAIEKNQRRVARLLEEIHAMKVLRPDLVTKTALQKNLNFNEVCKNPKSSMSDRAIARIASHPQFKKKIEDIQAAVKAFSDERRKGGKQAERKKKSKDDGMLAPYSPDAKAKKIEKKKEAKEEKSPEQAGQITNDDDKDTKDEPTISEPDEGKMESTQATPAADKKVTVEAEIVKKCEPTEQPRKKPQAKAQEKTQAKAQENQPKVVQAKAQENKPKVVSKPTKEEEKEEEESDLELSDKEDKPYFDDSTEERFHKQSSQEESDSENDFFVGKVSKFKKKKSKKAEGDKTKEDSAEKAKPADELQCELDELESRLKTKAPKLQTVFCSLSQTKPSRGGRGKPFRGQGKPLGGGRGDFDKKFRKEERGPTNSKVNRPDARRSDSERTNFRGRGRGDAVRQQDRRGLPHQAPQQALHPSWEASKKRKEQQGQILAFQGKKIKFDDDD
ncbi:serum response factor-binding protein 1 isoform X2 [Hippocampus comes]|uniref:serum response factor-binding protein 1 isoform X2 n=1 Tax=Hippocampus comes TaxID=109280 RepID=UPI00094E3871|nr:PREDICTED: serum response factor-binding protein 1 isoform X2 [Hippocampus comes]